jgi:hypothetical protein
MDEMNLNDEALFDRLVDGEISSADRRRLLASLDDQPGGWRRCALAFLEAQSWRTDLGQVARDAEMASPPLHARSATGVNNRFARRRAMAGLAIAASLLVGFGLGWTWQGDQNAPVAVGNVPGPGNQLVEATELPEPASPVNRSRDTLTLWVHDAAGTARPVHVPLVDAGTLDRQLGVQFRPGLPENARQHLEKSGYDVQSTRRYAPLWLDNGRSLVVPVEDTRIVPVSPVH